MQTVLLRIHPSAVCLWQQMGLCWPGQPTGTVGTFSQTTECTTSTRQHTTDAHWHGKAGGRRRISPSTTASVVEKVSENHVLKRGKMCSQRKNSNYSAPLSPDWIKPCHNTLGLLMHHGPAALWPVVFLSLWRIFSTDNQTWGRKWWNADKQQCVRDT